MKAPKVNRRSGSKFVCSLPEGFDDRSVMVMFGHGGIGQLGKLLVAHPTQHPVIVDIDAGTVTRIEPL